MINDTFRHCADMTAMARNNIGTYAGVLLLMCGVGCDAAVVSLRVRRRGSDMAKRVVAQASKSSKWNIYIRDVARKKEAAEGVIMLGCRLLLSLVLAHVVTALDIFTPLGHNSPCWALLSEKGDAGCRSGRDGAAGTLYLVKDEVDLAHMVDTAAQNSLSIALPSHLVNKYV